MADPKIYRALPGRGMRRQGWLSVGVSRCQLYVAEDHILQVDTSGYTEDYKRFYFRDIHAILLRTTQEWMWVNIILAVILALFIMGVVAVDDTAGKAVCGFFAALVAIPLLVNLFKGKTCVCSLKTAVQTEVLPSLNRLRRARKVIATLRPLITAAQGSLTDEELSARLQSAVEAHEMTPQPKAAVFATPPPLVPYRGAIHKALFWICAFDVPLTLLHVETKLEWLDIIGIFHIAAVFLVGITAIVRQKQTTYPPLLRAIPWTVTLMMPVFLVLSLVTSGDVMQNLLTTLSTTINGAGGVIGLLLLREVLKKNAEPPPMGATSDSPPPPTE